jgi:hypothetical protein
LFQCTVLNDCNFWTQFDVNDDPRPHHKCFLFKDCNIEEPCKDCETGPKNSPYHHQLYLNHLKTLQYRDRL